MSKILNIEEMLNVASNLDLDVFDALRKIESGATDLADAIAEKLNIKTFGASNDIGGICATFKPKRKGQACPVEIDKGDPDGDWD